jgi:hypothetical protein
MDKVSETRVSEPMHKNFSLLPKGILDELGE